MDRSYMVIVSIDIHVSGSLFESCEAVSISFNRVSRCWVKEVALLSYVREGWVRTCKRISYIVIGFIRQARVSLRNSTGKLKRGLGRCIDCNNMAVVVSSVLRSQVHFDNTASVGFDTDTTSRNRNS
jgi:hypothetical protein